MRTVRSRETAREKFLLAVNVSFERLVVRSIGEEGIKCVLGAGELLLFKKAVSSTV